jgi:hypothetical protein
MGFCIDLRRYIAGERDIVCMQFYVYLPTYAYEAAFVDYREQYVGRMILIAFTVSHLMVFLR